ncbi:MAG: hypothetical protein LAN64_00330 [Acidobacteriia bacterium]|nr:hypothetical protein [Terriglobia bacterium]
MRKRVTLLVFFLVCSAAAGDVGTVTIFRTIDHHRGWKPIAFCDGQRIAAVQGGKYVKMNASAGKHTFTSNNAKTGIDLEVKPGGDYFLRVVGTTLSENGTFELVDAVQARQQVDRLEPLKADQVAGVCRSGAGGQ